MKYECYVYFHGIANGIATVTVRDSDTAKRHIPISMVEGITMQHNAPRFALLTLDRKVADLFELVAPVQTGLDRIKENNDRMLREGAAGISAGNPSSKYKPGEIVPAEKYEADRVESKLAEGMDLGVLGANLKPQSALSRLTGKLPTVVRPKSEILKNIEI